jgi:predicted Rdx family selenoprotein
MVLVLAGGASAVETLVVPQGTTHTVTGKEVYDSFEVAGTLIVEKDGELTAGLGTDKPRSTIDGNEAKVIVNGGTIKLDSRINVGYANNATIIMNGGLFRIGNANSSDDFGDIKLPDSGGGTQRIILNGGLLWAHRCQLKFAVTDDAQIIIAGGEMRLDTMGDNDPEESYDPNDWLAAGRLLPAEDKGYTELVVSPNTPAADYYKISAIAKPLEALVVPQGATHTVTGKERYSSFEVAGTLIVEKGGELTAGLGTEKSVIDGLEAKVIVNGGAINLNSRIDVGNDSNATIIMNGGLFRIGNADSIDDAGDIKMPDDDGGHQRIILNGGLLWAHRCQMKFAVTDDAKIIVGGGEMRLDTLGVGEDPGEPESYDPNDWLAAGRVLLAENKGYTELVISPNTPTQNYYKISAIGAKAGY